MTLSFLANNPPRFEGPQVFTINVGQDSYYTFTVTDDGEVTLTIEPEGTYLDKNGSLYTIRWFLAASDLPSFNQTIRVIARDDLNATSLLEPQLQICACSSQGGNCTLDGLIDVAANPLILNCQCSLGKSNTVGEVMQTLARLRD